MTLPTPSGRPDYRSDLTRWNRAGLDRMQYVDANAALLLEELRIGMLSGYLRDLPPEERTPEAWRDLFTRPPAERPLSQPYASYREMIAWADLLPPAPARTETGQARNARLVEQYGRKSPDYAWEIMRAFARAAHVLTGHLDAYANEGYLRTATQWDNLRKLARMVNYLPTPPASATTLVALELAAEAGLVEIARGLAMKYTAPYGGAPLIFETLKPLKAHPELNGARASGWNVNGSPLGAPAGTPWILPDKASLSVGDVVALVAHGTTGHGRTLEDFDQPEGDGPVSLQLAPAHGIGASYAGTAIHFAPRDVRVGLPITRRDLDRLVLRVEGAGTIPPEAIVEISPVAGGGAFRAVVAEASGDTLVVKSGSTVTGDVRINVYTPVAAQDDGAFLTFLGVANLYFAGATGMIALQQDFDEVPSDPDDDGSAPVAHKFHRPSGTTGAGYLDLGTNRVVGGKVLTQPGWFQPTSGSMVRFSGAPPEGLKQGDWYVARAIDTTTPVALQVRSVRIEAREHVIVFSAPPPADPEATEFFGPMTEVMRPLHHDRAPGDAIVDGAVTLAGLSPEARDLIRPGKPLIVLHERDGLRKAAKAGVLDTETIGDTIRVLLTSEADFAGWASGWTRFQFNTVPISHGETQPPRTLGSGDAEQPRQAFRFNADNTSFVPSTASVTGVTPDMDVTVDGVKWQYRDLGDPEADGLDAWSLRLNDDDTLQIHFRRRLPTGTDNLAVQRHRLGTGLQGSGIPAWSMTKPMKKNRFVTAISQPFVTAGGADREPTEALRENAPANLAANGRAVSLRDFGRLCQRHASVLQARARQVIGQGSANLVEVIVVPAGGGAVAPSLREDLVTYLKSRALPGISLRITDYTPLPVEIAVTVLVDTDRHEKTDVQDAALAALTATFALERRSLGQPLYIAEILAAAEQVEGVASVLVDGFAAAPGTPVPLRTTTTGGRLSAIFPREAQLAFAEATGLAVTARALA